MKRVQSPSSINTYNQCPRKYFFVYNLKMPTSPSIHLVRGSIAHLVLEHVFEDIEIIIKDFDSNIQIYALRLLKRFWDEHDAQLSGLKLSEQDLKQYYAETQYMIINWTAQFNRRIKDIMASGKSFIQAFETLRPQTEIEYISENHGVKGFIDAIENRDGQIRLMDYKTSKSSHISEAYRLQLAIYALLYEEKHSVRPHKVGIYFLKDTEQLLDVTDDLISHARFNIENIHASTESDDMNDYPQKASALCKWSSGQCDFYDYCYAGKPIPEKPLKKEEEFKEAQL